MVASGAGHPARDSRRVLSLGGRARTALRLPSSRAISKPTVRIGWSCRPGCERPASATPGSSSCPTFRSISSSIRSSRSTPSALCLTRLATSQIEQAIRLEPGEARDGEPATYLPLSAQWTIRNPPLLAVTTPLPCDLAHAISIEFEGVAQPARAGVLILSGQGLRPRSPHDAGTAVARVPLEEITSIDSSSIDRAGRKRVRVVLEAVPENGWADPDIRSIWPGMTRTNWVEVEIVRR